MSSENKTLVLQNDTGREKRGVIYTLILKAGGEKCYKRARLLSVVFVHAVRSDGLIDIVSSAGQSHRSRAWHLTHRTRNTSQLKRTKGPTEFRM
ncbi:hypothetical protein NDU88_002029, partial [Pleurodeles waltl]